MPLLIELKGTFRPVFVCDHCSARIESAADGLMMWQLPPGRRPRDGMRCDPSYVHRRCCRPFEHEHGGRWNAAPLSASVVFMANNLALDDAGWEKAEAAARLYAGG